MLVLIYIAGCASAFLLGLGIQAVRIRRLEKELAEERFGGVILFQITEETEVEEETKQ